MEPAFLLVGKIVNTHGVRGELKIVPQTDFPEERFAKGSVLYAFTSASSEQGEQLKVQASRIHKGTWIVKFEEYNNINDVLRFKGGVLKVSKADQVELEDGQYYYHEIIGCEVFTENGDRLGSVKEILAPAANDVWVVKREGNKDLLIPVIDEVVLDVDIVQKRITIHVLEGLLD